MVSLISSEGNRFRLSNPELRKPKGFGISPYAFFPLIRCIVNSLLNGWCSYINPDRHKMQLLAKEGRITKGGIKEAETSFIKVAFLGDIMVSRSGKPPELNADVRNLLNSADVIVANVESPVVESNIQTRRNLSLKFEMNSSYLASIYACNRAAKWVFSIANNHACDTSMLSSADVSGVIATIENIKQAIPNAEVIGADIGSAQSVLSLQVDERLKIGIVAWTEVMNHDKLHYKKNIVRETDLNEDVITEIKGEHDVLIGFAHGNEEQSYYPLKETRDRWCDLISERKFDVIVGHGPHVLHPAEQVGDHGLLFHSIGNFFSPVGKSQTKIGCIPEITLCHQEGEISSIDYKVHILQQGKESLSLVDLEDTSQLYPSIIKRLKHIWNGISV